MITKRRDKVKKFLLAGVIVGVTLALVTPVMGRKFSFDLSKGYVVFNYTTTGDYNPLHLQILMADGYAQTQIITEGYKSEATIEGTGDLSFSQTATISGIELGAEIDGTLSSTTITADGIVTVLKVYGEGTVNKEVVADTRIDLNPEEVEIYAGVYVDAQSGRLIIEDSVPDPDAAVLISRKLGLTGREADYLLREFGKQGVMRALDIASSHTGGPRHASPTVAGGGGSVVADSISIQNLSPASVFQLSLRGLKFNGYLRDSTVYMRIYHPTNGVKIRDLDAIITIVDPDPSPPLSCPNVTLYDVFPYDYDYECYYYSIDEEDWLIDIDDLTPGGYDLYIDVGWIESIKLPVTVTEDKQVIARRVSN